MRAQFVRDRDSKKSLKAGMEHFKKAFSIYYELTPGIASKKELEESRIGIISDLRGIDPNIKMIEDSIINDESLDSDENENKYGTHYYGLLDAIIHTPLSDKEIREILLKENIWSSLLSIYLH